jgi:glutaryl-CoA dehydrogenase
MTDLFYINEQFQDEERLIMESVRQFVDEEVIDTIDAHYEAATFPIKLIPRFAELGLFGMTLPPEYGGSQASYVSYGLVCQELERGDSGLRSFVSVQNSLVMFPIFTFGSDEQKNRFLPGMARGEIIGCFGLTEPDSGSDPASMSTVAEKVSGGWVLNGSKLWITNATIADVAIIWAKTEEGVRGFLVERDFDGFITNEIKHKMSLRASITGEIVLEDCFVPDENLLPGSTKGLAAPLACLTQARYGIAWGAIGAADFCYQTALRYTQERIQFDRPIAATQLVQKDLVEMITEITKAKLLNLQLGRLKDFEKANYAMISMAKMNGCRQALNITRLARNLLGANGISLEYPIIRHMMNMETVFTYEGTDNIHHLIVGRFITGHNAF